MRVGLRGMRAVVLAAIVGGLFVGRDAEAREYGVDIYITQCDDLYEHETDGDIDDDALELLFALCQRPMDINRADRNMLYDLPAVTYELADGIIAYRRELDRFESVEQLREVDGVSLEIFSQIEPFISVEPSGEVRGVEDVPVSVATRLGAIMLQRSGREDDSLDLEEHSGPQAYLSLKGTGFSHVAFGAEISRRLRTEAIWDYSRGALVSEGPSERFNLDNIYVAGNYREWSGVLGSYDVGFAERLVFDTTSRRDPHGWYNTNPMSYDNNSGKLRPDQGLFGAVVSVDGMDFPMGWLDATAFVSYRPRDVYQYDYWYGLDDWHSSLDCSEAGDCPEATGNVVNACDTDGDCPEGYTCRDNRQCYATSVYGDSSSSEKYGYLSYKDAFDEVIVGANASWNFDEHTQVGVTAYRAAIDLNVAEVASPRFSYGARYPRRSVFGAIGVNGRLGWDTVELSGEAAMTDRGGEALYLRLIAEPLEWAETMLGVRWYGHLYDNPYSRGEAAATETLGLRSRNERGLRWTTTLRPIKILRLVTSLDVYQIPLLSMFSEEGDLEWADHGLWNMRLSQSLALDVTRSETASTYVAYRDNDLGLSGRDQSYYATEGGHGEQRTLRLAVSSTRIRDVKVTARYQIQWEDVSQYDDRFDLDHEIQLATSIRPWEGARLSGRAAVWVHDKIGWSAADLTPGTYYYDRVKPFVDVSVGLTQKIAKTWVIQGRYGFEHFRDDRPDAYTTNHQARVILEARL